MHRKLNVVVTLVGLLLLARNAAAQQEKVAEDPNKTQPIKVDASVPEGVKLTNANGESVSMKSMYEKQPLVVVFFRGSWCPFCTRHTKALMEIYPKLKEAGVELIAISPDSPENTQANIDEEAIPFPVFSDADVSAAKAFGLAFKVDDDTITKYKGYGIDLEKASGLDHHALPVPAVYLVDKDGKVVFAHSDSNYRRRLAVDEVMKAVQEKLLKQKENATLSSTVNIQPPARLSRLVLPRT